MIKTLKKFSSTVLAILILLAFFGGWLLVLGTSYELYKMREVQTWPSRRGVITHSYARQVSGFQNKKVWKVEMAGTYVGTGQPFGIDRVGYGFEQSVRTRKRAEQIAAQYPVNMELEIYHEPENPRHAILVRDNSAQPTWIAFGIGLGLGLLPLLLYGYGRLTG